MDKIQALHQAVGAEYELGELEEFRQKMQDEGKRRAFYDAVGQNYDLGTFDDFNNKLLTSLPKPSGPDMTVPGRSFMVNSDTVTRENHPGRFIINNGKIIDQASGGEVDAEYVKQQSADLNANFQINTTGAEELFKGTEDKHGQSYFEQLARNFQAGVYELGADMARFPAVLYSLAAVPQNAIVNAIGRPDLEVGAPEWLLNNPAAEWYDQLAEGMVSENQQHTESITGSLSRGQYGDAFRELGIQVARNLPIQIAMLAGGWGRVPSQIMLGGMSATAAARKQKELQDVELPELTKAINMVTHGMMEGTAEMLGTVKIGKYGKALIEKVGKEKARKLFEEGLENSIKTAWEKFYPITAPVGEGIEELVTQVGQNFNDIATGVGSERELFDGAADAFLVGAAASGTTTVPAYGIARISQGNNNRRMKKEILKAASDAGHRDAGETVYNEMDRLRKEKKTVTPKDLRAALQGKLDEGAINDIMAVLTEEQEKQPQEKPPKETQPGTAEQTSPKQETDKANTSGTEPQEKQANPEELNDAIKKRQGYNENQRVIGDWEADPEGMRGKKGKQTPAEQYDQITQRLSDWSEKNNINLKDDESIRRALVDYYDTYGEFLQPEQILNENSRRRVMENQGRVRDYIVKRNKAKITNHAQMRAAIQEAFGLSDEQADESMKVITEIASAWADRYNRPVEDWYIEHISEIKKGTTEDLEYLKRLSQVQYQQNEENLVAIHNIRQDGIRNVDKLGGLPAPSIAITTTDEKFESYGDISLLGSQRLVDPRQGAKVYDSDIYSPRYPTVEQQINTDKFNATITPLNKYAVYEAPSDLNWDGGRLNSIGGSLSMVNAWAQEHGIELPDNYDKLDQAAKKEMVSELYRIRDEHRNEINRWVLDLMEKISDGERIFRGYTNMGRRRYMAHTLDNVVRILKKNLRGGESFNYGAGSVRSGVARQFRTIKQIKDSRGKINSDNIQKLKDEMNDELINLAEQYRETYQYASDAFGYYGQFSEALQEAGKRRDLRVMKEWGFEIEDYGPIREYLEKLRNAPTEYFEAIIPRAVDLSEFQAAVVPEDADADVIQILRDKGLSVVTYAKGQRQEAVNRVAEAEKLLFETTNGATLFNENGQAIIYAFANGNISTLMHELAHVFRQQLTPQQEKVILNWTGEKTWTVAAEEKFARGFERYLATGKAPNEELREVFEKFKEWIREVYGKIKGTPIDVNLTPKVRAVFDQVLGKEIEITEKTKKRAANTLRTWIQEQGRIKPEELAQYGISWNEDNGLMLQIGAKKGQGMSIDDLAQTAIYDDENNPDGFLPPTPNNMNPSDWFMEQVRDNFKMDEDPTYGMDPYTYKEQMHWYEEMQGRGIIPDDMTFRQYLNLEYEELSRMQNDWMERTGQVLFQKSALYSSKLADVVSEKMSGAMEGEQLLNMLRKQGVKEEEIEYSGLKEYASQKRSKQEVLDYLEENQVRVIESLRGAPPDKARMEALSRRIQEKADQDEEVQKYNRQLAELNKQIRESRIIESTPDRERRQEIERARDIRISEIAFEDQAEYAQLSREQATKYENYTIRGSKKYRELLLQLPQKPQQQIELSKDDFTVETRSINPGGGRNVTVYYKGLINNQIENTALSDKTIMQRAKARLEHTWTMDTVKNKTYRSDHWDMDNVLTHIRFNEREIEGKNTLFIEEIQSDWHQEGRKKGYKGEAPEIYQDKNGDTPDSGRVPDAPFKKTWHELALRRMIRWAADNKFEQLGWTGGAIQAQRYDLSQQVDYIKKETGPHETYVHISTNNTLITLIPDNAGRITEQRNAKNLGDFTGKGLDEVIGKELAEKILTGPDEMMLKDSDLQVGGEGMKGFYDQILPAAAKKIGKRYGVKPRTAQYSIPRQVTNDPTDLPEQNVTVHVLDITPAMGGPVVLFQEDMFTNMKPPKRDSAEQEYIKEQARRGVDIRKVDTMLTMREKRKAWAEKVKQQKAAGQNDLFADYDEKQQTDLFDNKEEKQEEKQEEKKATPGQQLVLFQLENTKVLDKQGRPRKVFHGTYEDFIGRFDPDKLGSKNIFAESAREGFFFAGTVKTAKVYTELTPLDLAGMIMKKDPVLDEVREMYRGQTEKLDKVRQRVYKEISDEIKADAYYKQLSELVKGQLTEDNYLYQLAAEKKYGHGPTIEIDQRLQKQGWFEKVADLERRKTLEIQSRYFVREGKRPHIKEVYLNITNPYVYDFKGNEEETLTGHIKEAKRRGHDGVIFKNLADGAETDDIFVVFDADQIVLSGEQRVLFQDDWAAAVKDTQMRGEKKKAAREKFLKKNGPVPFSLPLSGTMTQAIMHRDPVSKMWRVTWFDARGPVGHITGEYDYLLHEIQIMKGDLERARPATGKVLFQNDAFKKWFGKSQITDEGGNPLIVYHGTNNNNVEYFDPEKIGQRDAGWFGRGFYFTPDSEFASVFLDMGAVKFPLYGSDIQPNILPVYLNIENPYFIDTKNMDWREKVHYVEYYWGSYENFHDYLKKNRHDGIIVKNKSGWREIVVFKPTQVKSVFNRGTYAPDNPKILFQDIYESKLEQVVNEKMSGAMNGDDLLNMLRKQGVKEEELYRSGLADFAGKKVSKEQVQNHLQANRIEISEIVYGAADKKKIAELTRIIYKKRSAPEVRAKIREYEEIQKIFGEAKDKYMPPAQLDIELQDILKQSIAEEAEWEIIGEETEWENNQITPELWEQPLEYNQKQGEEFKKYIQEMEKKYQQDYRQKMTPDERVKYEALSKEYQQAALDERLIYRNRGIRDNIYATIISKYHKKIKEVLYMAAWREQKELEKYERNTKTRYETYTLPKGDNYRELLLTLNTGETYQSGHWDDQNVLLHVRFNDRKINNKNTLFIEEIQSDWHQEGRKKGYGNNREQKLFAAAKVLYYEIWRPFNSGKLKQEEAKEKFKKLAEKTGFTEEEIQEEAARRGDFTNEYVNQGVPDAPFKKTWPDLALRRMLRWAADNGYQYLGWTTGKTQAKRYSLDQYLSTIAYTKENDKYILEIIATTGRAIPTDWADGATIETIEEYLGKEIAERINNSEGQRTEDDWYVLTGDDLKIEGRGMRAFYDQMLVKAAKKIGKQYGVQPQARDLAVGVRDQVERLLRSNQHSKASDVLFEYFVANNYSDPGKEVERALSGNLDRVNNDPTPIHAMAVVPEMTRPLVLFQDNEQYFNALRSLDNGAYLKLERMGLPEKRLKELIKEETAAVLSAFTGGVDKYDNLRKRYNSGAEQQLKRDVEYILRNGGKYANAELYERRRNGDYTYPDYTPAAAEHSEAFKKWFGKSKVVDKQGRPLVVYHGSPGGGPKETSALEEFSKRSFRYEGIYFTSDPGYASQQYAQNSQGGAHIYPVYISIQNPYIVDMDKDGTSGAVVIDNKIIGFYRDLSRDAIETLNSLGHDGIIAKYNDNSTFEVVAFNPTQVKSIWNNGEYNPDNPKILFQVNEMPLFQDKKRDENQVELDLGYDIKKQARASGYSVDELMNMSLEEQVQKGIAPPAPEGTYVIDEKQARELLKYRAAENRGARQKVAADIFAPISTRLRYIAPKVFARLRRHEFKTMQKTKDRLERVEPFLQATRKMSAIDYYNFDLARKNGDNQAVLNIVNKYNIKKEYNQFRAVLDEIYRDAEDVNFELGYRVGYHPRAIKDHQGFMEHFRNGGDWSFFEELFKEFKELKGELSDEQMIRIIDQQIRGIPDDKLYLGRTGNMFEREVEWIDSELNQFYYDSNAALVAYIHQVTDKIEARRFFGIGQDNLDESIGTYVLQTIHDGAVKAADETELVDILRARFGYRSTVGFWSTFKALGYLTTMGSPTSAITQIGDYAWSMYSAGTIRTLKHVLKRALFIKPEISRGDLGVDRIAEEFADINRLGRVLNRVFRLVGLDKMDALGKETLINATIERLQKQAQRDKINPRFDKILDQYFADMPGEKDRALADLKNGKISDNVKLIALNTLLDFQPVSLSEMPVHYLKSPNGRVWYMLKTFTIKQFDVFRREAIHDIHYGNAKEKIKGLRNLIHLAAVFVMGNATADVLKDLLMRRDVSLPDLVVDNIMRLVGFSRYLTWYIRENGPIETGMKMVLPPVPYVEKPFRDTISIWDWMTDDKRKRKELDPKNLETFQIIPVGGKLYYWWLGGGHEKTEKKKNKR